ncbi:MAG TPA: SRPBCC family protein [Ktedonosporobacter sp.]|nr:SRPBCC family protein [Ktedonosporobacter sp.]
MVKVVHTITIQSSASRLFAELMDFEHSYRWQTEEVLKEWHTPEGPVTIGTKGYQKRMFRGKPTETMNVVTVFEQDQRMVAESPSSRVEYQIQALSENEARLDFSIELFLKGVAVLFSPLIQRGLQKDVVARFQNLKRYLETGRELRTSW